MESFRSFYLAEAAVSPALNKNRMVKKVSNLIDAGDLSEEEASEMLEAVYYEEILPIAEGVITKFQKLVKKTLTSSKIRKNLSRKPDTLSQIKKLKGLKSKVIARGKSLVKIGDIVRGAILFETNEEVEMFISEFRRKNRAIISEYDFKAEGSDPKFGYFGSHHVDLMIDGLVVELQVMTKRLWTYKDKAHDIYTKMRDAKAKEKMAADYEKLPNSLKRLLGFSPAYGDDEEEMAHSKRLFQIGNKPRGFREDVDEPDSDETITEGFDPKVLHEMIKQIHRDIEENGWDTEWVAEELTLE